MHLLQVSKALIHVVLRSPQRDHITTVRRVREVDLYLVEAITDLLDLGPLLANDGLMEALLDQDVSTLLVLLNSQK